MHRPAAPSPHAVCALQGGQSAWKRRAQGRVLLSWVSLGKCLHLSESQSPGSNWGGGPTSCGYGGNL